MVKVRPVAEEYNEGSWGNNKNMDVKPKSWKLYRAIYDHFGTRSVEGSWPKERFNGEAARGYGIKFVIGVRVKRNRHYEIDVIVEGPEEVLKYILELVKRNYKMGMNVWDCDYPIEEQESESNIERIGDMCSGNINNIPIVWIARKFWFLLRWVLRRATFRCTKCGCHKESYTFPGGIRVIWVCFSCNPKPKRYKSVLELARDMGSTEFYNKLSKDIEEKENRIILPSDP